MNQSFAQAVKLIAMYLPQFHPIPENDRWWGGGFTEWTNVRKAEPQFPGHFQPHEPGKLGYYDLRDPDTRQSQADLAREYGIYGFCYYHYWFNGKRLLETPFNEVLASGKPDFPFCLCWANENWTRRWDGLDQEVLMAQEYSDEDSAAFIRDLFATFRDDRYIRVNGKALLLVYRTNLLPDPKRTAEIWREEMKRADMGELYLVRVENLTGGGELISPYELGFDAAMEFAPYWGAIGEKVTDLADVGLPAHKLQNDISVYDYEQCMHAMMRRPKPDYKLFRGVFPAWDNSSRRKSGATLFVNTSPEKYAYWLSSMLGQTIDTFAGDERLMFVNAWNEWGEGCHLEPDNCLGLGYLEATHLALREATAYDNFRLESNSAVQHADIYKAWYAVLHGFYGDGGIPSRDDLALLLKFTDLFGRRKELSFAYEKLSKLENFAETQRQQIEAQKYQIESQKQQIEFYLHQLEVYENAVLAKANEMIAFQESVSWKITKPIRIICDLIRGR